MPSEPISLLLAWDAGKDAESYRVYYETNMIKTTNLTLLVTNLIRGHTYSFDVTSIKGNWESWPQTWPDGFTHPLVYTP